MVESLSTRIGDKDFKLKSSPVNYSYSFTDNLFTITSVIAVAAAAGTLNPAVRPTFQPRFPIKVKGFNVYSSQLNAGNTAGRFVDTELRFGDTVALVSPLGPSLPEGVTLGANNFSFNTYYAIPFPVGSPMHWFNDGIVLKPMQTYDFNPSVYGSFAIGDTVTITMSVYYSPVR